MRSFFQLASPSCWFAACIVFFLPWIDTGCGNRAKNQQITMSGAQIAWGGETLWQHGTIKEWSLCTFEDWHANQSGAGRGLLTVYFASLFIAVGCGLVIPTGTGATVTCRLIFGHPMNEFCESSAVRVPSIR